MKLLVLGGSGLVGSAILKKGINSFDITSTYCNNEINIANVDSHHMSLPSDFNNLKDLIVEKKPEVVINTIAYANPDFCETHKKETYSLHVELTEKVSLLCSKINSKLIFISSEYVFDGKKGNYSEDDKPNPVNYYGYTKKLAEDIVLSNPNNTVLRTSLIYGWDHRVRFLNYVLSNLKEEKEVLAYNDIFYSPTLIDDLVESILKTVTINAKGIFHVVGSGCINKFDFAKAIAKIFKMNENLIKPIRIENVMLKAKRPVNGCLDNSKAKKLFGSNFSTVEEGIKVVLEKSKTD